MCFMHLKAMKKMGKKLSKIKERPGPRKFERINTTNTLNSQVPVTLEFENWKIEAVMDTGSRQQSIPIKCKNYDENETLKGAEWYWYY